MKIKYYMFYDILNYLAVILIYSDNINYCRVVKIGRFLQFSQHIIGQSEAD